MRRRLNHQINSPLHRFHSGLRVAHLALAVLVAFGFGPPNTFAVVLSNGKLSIDIRTDNGAINTALLNGKDFFKAGIPVSDWGIQNSTDTASFRYNDTSGLTQQPVTVASTATTVTVIGTYTASGSNVAFSRVYSLVAGVNALTVVTALTNNAASTINLRYFETFDPDQGIPLGFGSQTVNDVLIQGGIPVARSTATNDLTFTIGSIFGESSILASGGPFQINSGSILNSVVTAPFDGNGATADMGQHMVYVRSIAPGQTVVTHGVLAFGDTNVAAINDFVIAASTTGPGVSSDASTLVTTTSATLNGSVNPYNLNTTAFFLYGTDPTLLTGTTATSTQTLGNGSTVIPISVALTGLTPSTTYYYRASGTNANGTNIGTILSFSTGPDIAVEQPAGTNLVGGLASVNLPDALVATTSAVKTFSIRNVGNLDLTGLSITKDGANAADFTVTAPVSTTVVGGGSTTFTVSFTPSALGVRTATIHIASNDVDENPFDINLTGTGVASLPVPAYTFGVMGTGNTGFNGITFGSLFTVVTACKVTDLGAYDHGQDGLNSSMQVGIWDAAGTLLASTTVTTSDTLIGFFRYHTLATPVALTAGQKYYVGAMVANPLDAVGNSPASFTVDPRITFNNSVYVGGGSLARPANVLGSTPTYISSDFLLGSLEAAPTVTAVSPAAGSTAGGTSVTLTGTGFNGATGVTIGGTAATNVTAVSDTSIACTSPAGTEGTASVVVTTPGGSNAANTLYTYFNPVLTATYNSATDVPATAASYTATGRTVNFTLNYAPTTGTQLMVVKNTGLNFVSGTFDNLAQGQDVTLTYGGITYHFVANYFGGTGNDLVLQWVGTKPAAWGSDGTGELGNNSSTDSSVPVAVDTADVLAGKTVIAIASSGNHSLALCSDGTLAAWGYNASGQLGNNTLTSSSVPVSVNTVGVLAGKTVIAIAAGYSHSLALCSDGTVAAWGKNGHGQLGNNTLTSSSVPVAVNTAGVLAGKTVIAIAAGYYHSLALCSDGTAAAWGGNDSGQLGNNNFTNSSVPVTVNTAGVLAGKTVIAIAAGGFHNLALCSDGTVAAWGYNGEGEVGNNSLTDSSVPVAVNTAGVLASKTVIAIAAGGFHSLALCSNGTVAAWGDNFSGKLGNNSLTSSSVPVAVNTAGVLAGKTVIAIAAGYSHSLALMAAPPPPTLTSVSPASGSTVGGTSVTLTGTGFTGATGITIGGAAATSVTVVSDTSITCTTPAHAAGLVDVAVSTPGGAGTGNRLYTYIAAPVAKNITQSTSQVIKPGVSISCNSVGYHTDNSYWRAFNLPSFGVAGAFEVTSVEVGVESAKGNGGTQPITIRVHKQDTGTFPGGSWSLIGSTSTTVADSSTGTIITVPVGATVPAGSVMIIEVFTPSGQPTINQFFIGANTAPETGPSYISAPACGLTVPTDLATIGFPNVNYVINVNGYASPAVATVTAVSPATGSTAGGTPVTISGTNFSGASTVTIGSKPVTFSVVSSNTITATTDAHAAGVVDVGVTVPGGTSTGTGVYTYVEQTQPSITSNTLSLLATATTLTIAGTNFDAIAANNTVALSPTGTGTVTAATATSLTLSVSGLRAGALNAIVTTNGLSSGTEVQVATVIPVIASSTANLSTTATTLTINGFGFDPTASNNSVAFSPSGLGTVTASTATTLTVTHLSSLTAGALNAIVTSNGQASASAQVATVVTPPPATILTSTTDAPPDTTAGTPIAGATWDSVRSGMALASSGALAFRGHLAVNGTTVTADNFQGIWQSPDGSNAQTVLVARSGKTTAPGVAGGLFNVLPINPIINNAAQTSFVGFLTVGSGGVTTANDNGVWTELGTGGLKLAARKGSTVGTDTLGHIAPSGWISGGDSALAFTVRLSPSGTAIMRVDVSGTTATPSLVAKEGDAAPVVSGALPGNFDHFGGNSSDPRMDTTGNVAFAAWLHSGTSGVWYRPAGGVLSAVANSGQDTPGIVGSSILGFERPSLSGDGSTIAFRAFLSTGHAVIIGNPAAPAALTVLAKSYDTAIAGIPGGSMLWSVWSPFTNNSGKVAFRVTMLDGSSVETRAILTNTDGTLKVIAKAGDTAPGFSAETFVNFDHPVIGDSNQAAFIASTSAGNVGLFRQGPGGGTLALIAKVGDTVTISGGGSDTIAAITLPGSDSADRKYETKAMDAAGHILVHVSYVSGKTGLVLMGP